MDKTRGKIMKNEDAQKKICPMMSDVKRIIRCYTNECMMWEPWEYKDLNGKIENKDEGDCGLKSKDLEYDPF
jgi:hypothetical protein